MPVLIFVWIYVRTDICGNACGVMVIDTENGIGEPCGNFA